MAKLWALQILAGKKVLSDVPKKLKASVSEVLNEMERQNS